MTQARKPSRNELNARIARLTFWNERDTQRMRAASAIILELKAEVSRLQSRVDTLETELDAVRADLYEANNRD